MPGTSTAAILPSNSSSMCPAKEKKQEEQPEVMLDEDGWQVYDPTQFESVTTTAAIPAVELSDIGPISSSVFEELPANIRAVQISI
ncbi:unnamed protein product [Strongylus vulgaris]|uniref:Uncharacterized protein n=1 Tax=Strongylus vulgaris TaxID=40348 RepID=A0A3P7LTV6_STRVU|nr:unnamed protein product [Strongylus vulgaris]